MRYLFLLFLCACGRTISTQPEVGCMPHSDTLRAADGRVVAIVKVNCPQH